MVTVSGAVICATCAVCASKCVKLVPLVLRVLPVVRFLRYFRSAALDMHWRLFVCIEEMNLVEAEDVLHGELGRYVKFVGCVVGFDEDQYIATVQDGRKNKVPVRLLPTEKCLEIQKFQVCMFTGIIARRYDKGDERCLQMLSFMQVHYGLSLNEFEDVQRLRRNVLHECSAVNAKVANEVLVDLCDKFEFVVDDWNECLDVVVNHSESCEQCNTNKDSIPLEEFVSGSCDDPRVKCLAPLPVVYEDIVKQVFKELGEERYTSCTVRRLLDGLLS